MIADLFITGISQLATARGRGARRGSAMRDLHVIEEAGIAISDGRISWTGKADDWEGKVATFIDIGNRAIVPGLIDPHTHSVWGGDRLDDFDARTSGKSYETILAEGGGIRHTVHETCTSSKAELLRLSQGRINALIRSGATTIEVKSGYGLSVDAELFMLEVIRELGASTPAHIVPTLLLHLPPATSAERSRYIEAVCDQLIPIAAKSSLAVAVDIFVETGAWTCTEAGIILEKAKACGLAVKLHTEQFTSVGGLELGLRMGAISVDHLEACTSGQIRSLAESPTIATILPGVSLHLGIPAAPGRLLIDAGAAVSIGTDLNPGSSPLFSITTALALAVRLNGLTASEALIAGTVNSACALGLEDVGRLDVGLPANFLVLEGRDWRELVYALGTNPVREVWIRGTEVTREIR